MVVGAKVCELTDGFLWFVCGNFDVSPNMKCFTEKLKSLWCLVYNFALRKFDFRGQWSATTKNRGGSKKTEGQRALKNGGCSLAVGSYLQTGSAPPHWGQFLQGCPGWGVVLPWSSERGLRVWVWRKGFW